MSTRPWLLELLPLRLRQSLYYRVYHSRHSQRPDLFRESTLALCPHLSMCDLLPGDVISGNLAFNGLYDFELSRRIVADARKGGLFVDVGANMGYFSLLWAGCGPGSVVAVEAAPRNIALLRQNCERNGLEGRIRILPKAAADRNGFGTFAPGPAEQTGWGGLALTQSPGDVQIELTRLDEELEGVEVSVMKVDVEGADALVIRGCERLLREKRIGKIYFEHNAARSSPLGLERDAAQQYLRGLGYACSPLDKAHTEWLAVPAA